MPKGYFFAEIEITDPEIYRHYMPLAEAAVAAYGGRYIVRGGDMRVREGIRPVCRAVILIALSRPRRSTARCSTRKHSP